MKAPEVRARLVRKWGRLLPVVEPSRLPPSGRRLKWGVDSPSPPTSRAKKTHNDPIQYLPLALLPAEGTAVRCLLRVVYVS